MRERETERVSGPTYPFILQIHTNRLNAYARLATPLARSWHVCARSLRAMCCCATRNLCSSTAFSPSRIVSSIVWCWDVRVYEFARGVRSGWLGYTHMSGRWVAERKGMKACSLSTLRPS